MTSTHTLEHTRGVFTLFGDFRGLGFAAAEVGRERARRGVLHATNKAGCYMLVESDFDVFSGSGRQVGR